MLRMLLRYFPDKMWMKGNMDRFDEFTNVLIYFSNNWLIPRAAPSWYDGISTFHIDQDERIYKHVVDRVMGDQDPVTLITKLFD